MEFPILHRLLMPQTAIRTVTEFLREPHPTAALIKALRFSSHPGGFSIYGNTLRFHQVDTYPPRFFRGTVASVNMMRVFQYDEDGEPEIEDYGDGLTVDDMRMLGMSDSELASMGYTLG